MSQKIPIGEVLSDTWADLSAAQKFVMVALIVMALGAIAMSWWNTFQTWGELRVFESQKIEAQREAKAALEVAAKIAREKVEAEKKIVQLEVKRDEKITEVEAARVRVIDDRLELNRVRRERRGDNPTPQQLCAELAELGYPCG